MIVHQQYPPLRHALQLPLFIWGSVRLRGASVAVDGRPCSVARSSLPARALPFDSDAPLRLAPSYRWEVPPAGKPNYPMRWGTHRLALVAAERSQAGKA
ncbi:hypothetical protein GCM10009680_70260 [Streptomyces yatensis]|uniref:Uncharacterized protein n=1 Tax=Streptomyces yatensis TaxID=155177 RepID=A0ABP4V8S6_9ACTN